MNIIEKVQGSATSISYSDITHLEQTFRQKGLGKFPENILVQGINYHYHESTNYGWEDLIQAKKKAISIFTVTPSKDNLARFKQFETEDADDVNHPKRRLVLMWDVNRDMKIVPTAARFMTRYREMHVSSHGFNESIELGFTGQIVINNINGNQPIPCKIDTGADMCSLHAENVDIQNGSVTFIINGKQYRMPVSGSQTVKQADSNQETRPTVKFDIELSGQTISGVECNLNDRTGMSPMLVGKNLLAKGDFIINTNLTEGYVEPPMTEDDWSHITALLEHVTAPEPTHVSNVHQEDIDNILHYMLETDCSMKDLIYYIQLNAITTLNEDVTY